MSDDVWGFQTMLAYSKCALTIEVYASDFTAELQPNKEHCNRFNT